MITTSLNNIAVLFTILNAVMGLSALVGGLLVFKSARKQAIITIQDQTIETMQQQIDALKEQNAQQQFKLDRQEFELQAMREALKDEGIYITVDGEKVTIKDVREPHTIKHVIKNPTKKIITTATVKKTEEGT